MPVRASSHPLKPRRVCGLVLGLVRRAALKDSGGAVVVSTRSTILATERQRRLAKQALFLYRLTSNQVGIPAELKHINKRRKRNQPGLPQ